METIAYVPPERAEIAETEAKPAQKSTVNGENKFLDGVQPESEEDREIARLVKLSRLDYERERKDAAERLGVRASILDKLVAAERPADESKGGQGRRLELPEPEPWPKQVNGVELISELEAAIRRYVVLSAADALACALWILHTYCFDAFTWTPRLSITSPEMRCGKTTLLRVIGELVPRALKTENITAAALFRTVELARPILLIDEADTFLPGNEELRGILNSGYLAGGQVTRTVGDDNEPRLFSTHCPAAVAQIGKLPGTLADRSVMIAMRRGKPSEKGARFRLGKTPELSELARKAARFIAENVKAIASREPFLPDSTPDRVADNWESLLAVAEVAGGDVADRARHVMLEACGVEAVAEQSLGTLLLADVRDVLMQEGVDRISSAELVDALAAMLERPWPECRKGKPITQNWLARRLRDFGIYSRNVKIAGQVPKGYHTADFSDAFSRYLPETPFQSATAATPIEINNLDEKQSATRQQAVAVQNSPNLLKTNVVAAVALQNPESGARDESGAVATGSKKVTDRSCETAMPADNWGLDEV